MDAKELEQTLVLIKPDALKNSLTGYLLSQLAEFHTGLHFAGTKVVQVGRMLAEEHYAEHRGKPFYPSLLDYIMGRLHYEDAPWKQRVIAIVYQGPDAIKRIRDFAGTVRYRAGASSRPVLPGNRYMAHGVRHCRISHDGGRVARRLSRMAPEQPAESKAATNPALGL